MKKAAFYGRYSSTNQTEQSIEGQLHVCERYAADNGYTITAHYVDRAKSATSDNRPEFQRMIADSKAHAFEAVLVYKLDRFTRNRFDSAVYKKKLRDNGVKVISATENISDSPEGIIMEGLLESMDEYYSAELSRKTKRGRLESFNKGYFLNPRAPFGYRKVDRRLEIDENTAPTARRIFQEYADGKTINRICTELNAEGLTAFGKPFRRDIVKDWLENEIYIGVYRYGEHVQEVPALITAEVWERVQAHKATSKIRYRNKSDFTYYFTGRTFCMNCGSKLIGHSSGKFRYYRCYKCGNYHNARKLHDRVRTTLAEYMTPDKVHELASAAYAEYQKTKPTDPTAPLRAELRDVQNQLHNATVSILTGLDSPTIRTALQELESRQAKLIDEIERVENRTPQLTLEHFEFCLSQILGYSEDEFERIANILIGRVYVSKEHAVICINLTNTDEKPPIECVSVERGLAPYPPLYTNGWLLIAA